MEKLPPEIIQYVAGLLDQYPPSLRAFACVSWGCYYVASTYLFHTLHFKVLATVYLITAATPNIFPFKDLEQPFNAMLVTEIEFDESENQIVSLFDRLFLRAK